MHDAIFAEPRLARIYDVWEGDRIDLPGHLAIVAELGARSVLDESGALERHGRQPGGRHFGVYPVRRT